ncbi:MAG: hypothetical protein MUF49_14275 [Oculatellaceae cyanobacterium Prado106]|nr:hypothetical protein [Oculatellaceae cyanobacterium Prado106]
MPVIVSTEFVNSISTAKRPEPISEGKFADFKFRSLYSFRLFFFIELAIGIIHRWVGWK